jgi:hypothetical protein
MKRAIIALSILSVAFGVYGQGFIKFQNAAGSLITTNLFGVTGSMAGPTDTYQFQLLIGPDGGTPAYSAAIATVTNKNNALSAGRIANRTSVEVPGNVGDFISVQLVGWSRNLGNNYNQFLANLSTATTGFYGTSEVGRVALSSSSGVSTAPPILFDSAATYPAGWTAIPGFALSAVPEPSAIALGVLGLGALILFRRRKN